MGDGNSGGGQVLTCSCSRLHVRPWSESSCAAELTSLTLTEMYDQQIFSPANTSWLRGSPTWAGGECDRDEGRA